MVEATISSEFWEYGSLVGGSYSGLYHTTCKNGQFGLDIACSLFALKRRLA